MKSLLETAGVFQVIRYYFHVKRGQVTVLDQEGVELAGIEDVAKEAIRRGREIAACEDLTSVSPNGSMIIVDDDERTVFRLPFDTITG